MNDTYSDPDKHHELLQAFFYHMAKPTSRFSLMNASQLQQLIAMAWPPSFVRKLIALRPEYREEFERAIEVWKRETNQDGSIALVPDMPREQNIISLADRQTGPRNNESPL
jgi:hypothetical protein